MARDAAAALGTLRDAAAVEPLIDVLNDANGYFHSVVRAAAALSLAQLGDARAIDALVNAINDPIAEASAEAIRALGALANARAISPLINVTRNQNGYFAPIARRAAVLALAQLGGDDAVLELRAVAANTWEDSVVREEAEKAIQRHGATKSK